VLPAKANLKRVGDGSAVAHPWFYPWL